MWLEVMGDSPALDVEGVEGRPVGRDKIAFKDDRLVARAGHGERSRESRDAASGDDELHTLTLSGRGGTRQAMSMEVRALTRTDAAAIASWRYPGRYSTYDFDEPPALASEHHWAVTEAEELIGYCCFGAPARVGGAGGEPGTLDVGYGLAPGRMGSGLGHRFVGAILEFALERFDPERLRLYVLDWNERSKKVAVRHGFAVESVLPSGEGPFLVMVRRARD